MPPSIATVVYVLAIAGLFVLNRDPKARTSKALWIPVVWLLISGSRPVSLWLQIAPSTDSREQYLEGSPLDRVVFTALLMVGLAVLLGRRRQVGELMRGKAPILLFLLYCAVSILWSDYPFVALKRWIKSLGDIVMVMIVLTDSDRSAAIKQLLTRVGFLLLPVSVLLIKYYPDLGRQLSMSWELMYSGVAMQKNELGIICVIFGLASIWRLRAVYHSARGNYRTRQLIAHGALLGIAMWLLWRANSVTAINCFIIGGSLMLALRVPKLARKKAAVHLLVVAAVAIPFAALFLNTGTSALETMGRNSTLTGRTEVWALVLRNAGNPWFGTGFESYWLGDRLDRIWSATQHINEAHNGYLEVYLNLGWAGIALLVLVIGAGYRNIMRIFRRNPDSGTLYAAYFVTALIYGFTEAAFRMLNPMWIMFLLVTIATPACTVRRVPAPAGESRVNRLHSSVCQPEEYAGEEVVEGRLT